MKDQFKISILIFVRLFTAVVAALAFLDVLLFWCLQLFIAVADVEKPQLAHLLTNRLFVVLFQLVLIKKQSLKTFLAVVVPKFHPDFYSCSGWVGRLCTQIHYPHSKYFLRPFLALAHAHKNRSLKN